MQINHTGNVNYIKDLAFELYKMAAKDKNHFLATLLEMVVIEADNVLKSTECSACVADLKKEDTLWPQRDQTISVTDNTSSNLKLYQRKVKLSK